MSIGELAQSEALPLVAIVSDHPNVNAALDYELELHELDFETEWVIPPETLLEWDAHAIAAPKEDDVKQHPFLSSQPFRCSNEALFKNPEFQINRARLLQEADVILGVNRISTLETENVLTPFTSDCLVVGATCGRLAVVSEVFPNVSRVRAIRSFRHAAHLQRGLQLNGYGVKRAEGDMTRVRRLYEESLVAGGGNR